MTKKATNLQPWIDYFRMLQQYAEKGFLEIPEQREQNGTRSGSAESRRDSTAGQVKPADHEAYITMSALFTLAGVREETIKNGTFLSGGCEALTDTVTRIRAYAAFLNANAIGQQHQADIKGSTVPLPVIPATELATYLEKPFALHIVVDVMPHELLHTILLTPKRNRRENVEVISYSNEPK